MSQSRNNPVAHMAKNAEFMRLFPAQVMKVVLPGTETLRERLREIILAREVAAGTVSFSNRGGWQSGDNIFAWEQPELKIVHDYMMKAVQLSTDQIEGLSRKFDYQFKIYGWANVNRAGDYNVHHIHPGSTWSCVYYVDAGDDDSEQGSGFIEMHEPNVAATMAFFPSVRPDRVSIRPVSGMLLVFPSYLLHSVQPYAGERSRISIAANAHGSMVTRQG